MPHCSTVTRTGPQFLPLCTQLSPVALHTCSSFQRTRVGSSPVHRKCVRHPSYHSNTVSLRRAGVEQLYQVKRMIGGIVSLFCLFSQEKTKSGTRTFHDMCCWKLLTFHNGFMLFASRSCVKHFFRFQAPLLLHIKCETRRQHLHLHLHLQLRSGRLRKGKRVGAHGNPHHLRNGGEFGFLEIIPENRRGV